MQSQPMCESFRIHTHFTSSKFLKSQQPFGKKTDLSTHQFLDHVERSTLANNYSDSAIGGGERDRTDDLMLAKHALSQLSYTPFRWPPISGVLQRHWFARTKRVKAEGCTAYFSVGKRPDNAESRRLSRTNGGSGWVRTNDPRLIKTVL